MNDDKKDWEKCIDDQAWLVVPAGVYLLKVNNRNTRTRREICSELTLKTPRKPVSVD